MIQKKLTSIRDYSEAQVYNPLTLFIDSTLMDVDIILCIDLTLMYVDIIPQETTAGRGRVVI